MRIARIACLAVVALVASCGGGGGASAPPVDTSTVTPTPAPSPIPTSTPTPISAPWIRFEGDYEPTTMSGGPSVAVRTLVGSTTIAANAVAKVELQTNGETPQILGSPNATDSHGSPQYLFAVTNYPVQTYFHNCLTTIPLRIVVTDTTGFSFTKNTTFCPSQPNAFGGFSDYGDRNTAYALRAAQPASAGVRRIGGAGYSDAILTAGVTSFNQALPALEGDALAAYMNYPRSTPDGVTAMARVDAEGGAFAESAIATNALNFYSADAGLVCCRLKPTADNVTSTQKVRLTFIGTMYNVGNPPPAPYDFSYRVTDPASGAVVYQRSGSATGYTSDLLDMKIGYQIDMSASVTLPDTTIAVQVLRASDPADPNAAIFELGHAASNIVGVPARLSVFCCSK